MKSKNNLVEKSNKLMSMSECEMAEKMSLTEFRFFCLYLSKLDPRKPNNRTVVIPMKDFEDLFDVKVNTTLFTKKIYQILKRSMIVYNNGKTSIINLYSKFEWYEDAHTHLEITCNYDIVPYLFELQKNYTSYRIANISKLNSVAKIRLYEICKQYEKISEFTITLEELLRIMQSEIVEFKFFNSKVLKPAIRDINEYTDIQISYVKKLSCRKVVALVFTVKKREFSLPVGTSDDAIESQYDMKIQSLYYRCDKVYTMEQLKTLFDYVDNSGIKLNIPIENYIYSVYANIKFKDTKVKNLFKYTLGAIKKQIEEHIFA